MKSNIREVYFILIVENETNVSPKAKRKKKLCVRKKHQSSEDDTCGSDDEYFESRNRSSSN